MNRMTIDFSRYADYPLVNSKFGLYICTYVDTDRILRDMPALKELQPYGLRYDPGWGFGNDEGLNSPREMNAPQVEQTNGAISIQFADYDRLVDAFASSGVRMMHVQAYNPICLQGPGQAEGTDTTPGMRSRWNTMPVDLDAWEEINRRYAEHFRGRDNRRREYEIWNEPDLQPVFFTGSKEEYFRIYVHGSKGVLRGDPAARVGGPALANCSATDPAVNESSDWAEDFLDRVQDSGTPLHFFSYHNYVDAQFIVPVMRDAIRNREGLERVETIITEYNSYKPGKQDFTVGGKIERHHAAIKLLLDFQYFVQQPDVSCVYWAQFNDPEVFGNMVDRCGLVALDGTVKAAYNAYRIYSRMPADRVRLSLQDERIGGFASTSDSRCSVVLWNSSDEMVDVDLDLMEIPFEQGTAACYKIDAWRCSHTDNPLTEGLLPCGQTAMAGNKVRHMDQMLPQSVLYLELSPDNVPDPVPIPVVHDIRHYYNNRYSKAYAEFDEQECAAYLGMAGEESATCLIEVDLDRSSQGVSINRRDFADAGDGCYGFAVEEASGDGSVVRRTYCWGNSGELPAQIAGSSVCEGDPSHFVVLQQTNAQRRTLQFFIKDLPTQAKVKYRIVKMEEKPNDK